MVRCMLPNRLLLAVMSTVLVVAPGAAQSAPRHLTDSGGALAPSNIIRIDGAAASDHAGGAVADAGDVNGDGRADVLVGGTCEWTYAVFGQPAPTIIDLARLGTRGFRIYSRGSCYGGEGPDAVAGAGDVNGDGRADVIVGAVWGNNGPSLARPPPRATLRMSSSERLTVRAWTWQRLAPAASTSPALESPAAWRSRVRAT